MTAKEKHEASLLKRLINQIRDQRKYTINSDDLNEEALYYLQEGYREGMCSIAMMLADELDAVLSSDPDYDLNLLQQEEMWWHTHNDEEGDVGSPERLK